MEKMMNVFYGCQVFNRKLAYKIRTLIKNKSSMPYGRTPTALVINVLQNTDGVRKFLSSCGLISASDFQRLFICFENYKIPIFVVSEELYAKAVRLVDHGGVADVQSSLLMSKTHQTLAKTNRSAFSGTDLDKELNQLGIKNIIFTGEMTPLGLLSTRRDAELLGYQTQFARNITEIDGELTKVKYPVNGAKSPIRTLSEINLL